MAIEMTFENLYLLRKHCCFCSSLSVWLREEARVAAGKAEGDQKGRERGGRERKCINDLL